MAPDQDHAVLSAIYVRQASLELAVNGALSGHRAACRYCGAIMVNRRLGGFRDPCVSVQCQVVVGRKIDIATTVDHGCGASDPVMNTKERVRNTKIICSRGNDVELSCAVERARVKPVRVASARRQRRKLRDQPGPGVE